MNYQNKLHFSHPHLLLPLQLDEGEKIECKACNQLINEIFYGCLSCAYYLHNKCMDVPRSLEHPAHPRHPLTLHSIPTYAGQSYKCNACGSSGHSFSFSCAHCEFDLHVPCASFADVIRLDKHPHELKLVFGSPSEVKNAVFRCEVCKGAVEPSQWFYYCKQCDFGVHLHCVKVPNMRKWKHNSHPPNTMASLAASTVIDQGEYNRVQEMMAALDTNAQSLDPGKKTSLNLLNAAKWNNL